MSSRADDGLSTDAGPSGRDQSSDINWDWKFALGKRLSRKPAIRRPARHQWYYCNPNYDPSAPLPTVLHPPYAPPSATQQTDWVTYRRHLRLQPANRADEERYRQHFIRHLKLRDVDWREAFQRGIAEDVKGAKKREKWAAEAKRQEAWAAYKAALFERARLGEEASMTAAAGAVGAGSDGGSASLQGGKAAA